MNAPSSLSRIHVDWVFACKNSIVKMIYIGMKKLFIKKIKP
jgi:hypothetical protein